jgi:hypothetical protein
MFSVNYLVGHLVYVTECSKIYAEQIDFLNLGLAENMEGNNIVTDPRKSGPLPLNGQLVTDVISAVTDTDSYRITRNGWAKHCIRGNRYTL